MKKETVLEIEFQPVFDKWAWKITKQNEEILIRNEFIDKELNVESLRSPDFLFLTNKLFLRGDVKSQDDNISFCNQEEKALIEIKVKAINEKYGIKMTGDFKSADTAKKYKEKTIDYVLQHDNKIVQEVMLDYVYDLTRKES